MRTIETTFPSTEVSREILTLFVQHKLPADSINVYLYLALHSDDTGSTEPLKPKQIAEGLGLNEGIVYQSIQKLAEAGLFVPDENKLLASMESNISDDGFIQADDCDFGACCICESTEQVRNIIQIDASPPTENKSYWICPQCGVNGAMAVICDKCIDPDIDVVNRLKFFVKEKEQRLPIELLGEPVKHDPRYHPELRYLN